ncbi:MAG: 1-deoxy-D-xylulose-5-phosphate reductoisomerase, partial [Gammaproteobacteria bacterium]|nr:1-deoxy-D-xylulose-5-phosphate reductoisomerase [Gammaproteobacteria bacterium]
MKRHLCILGSTGSIGLSTLDVVRRHLDKFSVRSLSANASVDAMYEQCSEFLPETVVMVSEKAADELSQKLITSGIEHINVQSGVKALEEIAQAKDTDTVMAAIVGASGLLPTLAAVTAGKRVLLANKEALVTSG